MSKVSVESFLELHDHFSSLPVPKIQYYLDLSEGTHCPTGKWVIDGKDDRQIQGIILRTAHYLQAELTQIAYAAAMGAAIQKGQSIPTPPNVTDLESTIYGQQFKALQRRLPTRVGTSF